MTHITQDKIRKDIIDIVDNITEGRLKHLIVYRPSFVGSSHKPMLEEIADSITKIIEEEKKK